MDRAGDALLDKGTLAVLAAVATLPVLCAALFGYDGHDYPFHLATWLDLEQSFLAGDVRPGWAALANHGLGDAHLQYYPPVTPLLAALLAILLPLQVVPGVMLWLASLLAGVSMWVTSGLFLKGRERVVAAVLYAINPYLLTTGLTRFAIGELFLQAWLPLVVLLLLRALSSSEPRARARYVALLGGLLGLSWLTNVPGSIALGYVLGGVCVVLAVKGRSSTPLLALGIAEAIAIGLAAFHHIPAFAERSFVQAGQLLQIERWFMVLPLATSARLFGLSAVIMTWVGIALVGLSWWRLGTTGRAALPGLGVLVGIAALAFFFLLPFSNPLWNTLPLFSFIQLPLRFVAEIYLVLPIAVLLLPLQRPWRGLLIAGVAGLAVLPIAMEAHGSGWGKRARPVAAVVDEYARGYQGQPEYWPSAASGTLGAAQIASIPLVEAAPASCQAKASKWDRVQRLLEVRSDRPCELRVKLLCHPYWVTAPGAPEVRTSCDARGLLALSLPAGEHTVELRYRPATKLRTGTALTSIAMLLTLMVALWLLRARADAPAARS